MHIERKKDNDIHRKGNKQNIVSAIIRYRILILMAVATIIISPLLSCQAATSNSNNNYNNNRSNSVFSADSKPYDLTYVQWTTKWWQWAYSIPKEINPSYDDIGKNCAQGQSGPVWFLTGTYGHAVDRYCDIPAGKTILFTILNSECSYAEFPNIKTEKELRECSKEMQDTVIHIEASVDGINIKNLNNYRIQSSLFNFTLPKNNILGLPPQTTQAVSDGNWVFLEPLSIGKHVIYFKGGLKSNNVTTTTTAKDGNYAFAGPYGWDFPNTYHITVLNSTHDASATTSSNRTILDRAIMTKMENKNNEIKILAYLLMHKEEMLIQSTRHYNDHTYV